MWFIGNQPIKNGGWTSRVLVTIQVATVFITRSVAWPEVSNEGCMGHSEIMVDWIDHFFNLC